MDRSQSKSLEHNDLENIDKKTSYIPEFSREIDKNLTQKLKSVIRKYPDSKVNLVFLDVNNNKLLVDIASQEMIPAASLIKLLVLIESMHQKNEYNNYDKPIQLKPFFKADGAGLLKYLPDDYTSYESVNKNFLNYLMIANSDNYATNTLIHCLSFEKINDRSKKLGLKQTKLNNMLMLRTNNHVDLGNNTTSLLDMAMIMEYIYVMSKKESVFKEAMLLLGYQCDRSAIPKALPLNEVEKVKMYNKTGTLNNARYDVALIETRNNTYVLGVRAVNKEQKANLIIVDLSREILQKL